MLRSYLFSICLALACGCSAEVHYRSLTTHPSAPRDPRTVAIYTLPPVGLRYEVVGYVRADSPRYDTEPGTSLLARLRDAAAEHGCGALLLDHGYCVEDHAPQLTTASSLEAACIEVLR